jgi:hypothetical protein
MRQAPQSVIRTLLVPTALGLVLAAGLMFPGCKQDEPPPPLPSATAAAAEPAAPIELLPEEDAGDADADAGKKYGGPMKPRKSLANCCAALRQNAANAPAPTNTYMLYAAGICDGAAAANKDAAVAMPAIRAALKGAALPAACY